LISELLRQTRLIEVLNKHPTKKLRVYNTFKFDAENLLNIRLINGPMIYPTNPLLEQFEKYFFVNGYPTISEADNDEVI
jgi:hypothetical protein